MTEFEFARDTKVVVPCMTCTMTKLRYPRRTSWTSLTSSQKLTCRTKDNKATVPLFLATCHFMPCILTNVIYGLSGKLEYHYWRHDAITLFIIVVICSQVLISNTTLYYTYSNSIKYKTQYVKSCLICNTYLKNHT